MYPPPLTLFFYFLDRIDLWAWLDYTPCGSTSVTDSDVGHSRARHFRSLVTRCFQEPEGTCSGEHVVFRCLSTTEVYFCARPGPVPSEESLPQPTTALSLSMRSQPPPAVLWSRHLSPPLCVTHRPRRSGLGILVVLRVFTVWKGSGLVSSHGVCVLLFGARTGKGFVRGR